MPANAKPQESRRFWRTALRNWVRYTLVVWALALAAVAAYERTLAGHTTAETLARLGQPAVIVGGAILALWLAFFTGMLILSQAFERRQQIRHTTRCGGCRYDLTGNQSGTCPECGMPIPSEQRERIDASSERR